MDVPVRRSGTHPSGPLKAKVWTIVATFTMITVYFLNIITKIVESSGSTSMTKLVITETTVQVTVYFERGTCYDLISDTIFLTT